MGQAPRGDQGADVAALDRPDRHVAGHRRESAGVTGRVFDVSGRVLSVAEGWHRGPTRRARRRSRGRSGPVVRELVAEARPNADMDGELRPQTRQPKTGATMPINPDAVGTKGEPVETSWTSKDALLYAVGVGRRALDELEFTTENTDGVAQQVLPTMAVVLGPAAAAPCGTIGTFNPAMLVHGEQAIDAAPADPRRGHGPHRRRDHRHLRQGQGRGRRHRVDVDRRDDRRAAVHDHACRRSSAARAAGAATAARPAPRNVPPERAPDHTSPTRPARPGAALPPLGRPQPAALRPVVRGHGRLRPADPPRPVHLRVHRPGAAARAVRRRSGPLPAMEGRFSSPVLPRRRPHDRHVGRRRRSTRCTRRSAVGTAVAQDLVVIDQGARAQFSLTAGSERALRSRPASGPRSRRSRPRRSETAGSASTRACGVNH